MSFVMDASVILAWILPDEVSERADAIVRSLSVTGAVAPAIWPMEIRNALLSAERRRRIDPATTQELLAILGTHPVAIDNHIDLDRAMLLARNHRLTLYDAAYLELATRRRLPLATLDGRLAAAAAAEGCAFTA
ncbi:type II toxin-antitoxin system VapC family toxin [Aquibium carbonis]|nr:type II toxin-antitoxin system VapC family toxin [Aquibium carbonis]